MVWGYILYGLGVYIWFRDIYDLGYIQVYGWGYILYGLGYIIYG